MSPEEYSALLMQMPWEERCEHLKALDGNELFWDAIRLLPSQVWEEFMWFEKRTELESTLKHAVPLTTLQTLADKEKDALRPIGFESLIKQWSEGDEYWYYHDIPGDTGYALVRGGRVVDYCTLEVNCI